MEVKKASELAWQKKVEVAAPNCYNKNGYLKWGIYKPGWAKDASSTGFDSRLLHHDNVRVGKSLSSIDPTA